MSNVGYPIVIAPLAEEDGGGFVAFAPDLKGCMSDGATRDEAASNIEDAICEWLDEAEEAGLPIPVPFSSAKKAADTWRKLLDALNRQGDVIEQLESEIHEMRELMAALADDCDAPVSLLRVQHATVYSLSKRIGAH